MRRSIFTIFLAILLCSACLAVAEGVNYVALPPATPSSARITANVPQENPAQEGVNPLTGESWYGLYHPIMVQIDSDPAALPHWGVSSADIMYEMPLHSAGNTRSVALFMSEIPSYAGPVRSARVPMASLREMWGGAWVFYGIQEYFQNEEPTVDVQDFVTTFHKDAVQGGRWIFPFMDGTQMQYFDLFARQNDSEHVAPHNATINTRGVEQLFQAEPLKHPFRFTDTGLDRGADVTGITVTYKDKNPGYVSSYEYNPTIQKYLRYREGELYYDGINGRAPEYANVIVLYTNVSWFNGNASRPVIRLVGQGTADLFQNGKYIRGTWIRGRSQGDTNERDAATLASRMVFLDENGNEFELMRGKTFIQIVDERLQAVNVTTSSQIAGAIQQATPVPTATPRPTRTPPPTRPPRQGGNSAPVVNNSADEEVEFGG